MEILYAYYSETQKNNNGKYYVYFNDKETEIIVTEVRHIKKENITDLFKDNYYLGVVTQFVRSVTL